MSDGRHWFAAISGLVLWIAINFKIILDGLPDLLSVIWYSPSDLTPFLFHSLAFEAYTIIAFSIFISRFTYFRYCSKELPYLNFPVQELKKLTHIVYGSSGIKEVFSSPFKENQFTPSFKKIIDQAVKNSKTVKIMSIAGYAYVGRGRESLLYRHLESGRFESIKVVTVDPDRLAHIRRRAEELDLSWIDYERRTQLEFKHTKEQCKKLFDANIPLKFKVMRHDPVFRLVIFDDLLLLSAYEEHVHGHESPVYVIYRVPKKNKSQKTLFNSFCNLFDNVFTFAYPVEL